MIFQGDKIKSRLNKVVEDSGMTLREIEEKSGISRSTIQRYLTGDIAKIPIDKLQDIVEAIGASLEYVLGLDDMPPELLPVTKKKFPILGEIACGQPIYAEENHEAYFEASSDINADFCLVAKGDSMIDARIHDGDVVFIKSTSVVENGSIAAVVIGDEATLKRWYFYPQEKKLILVPANSKYAPIIYMGKELNEVRCIGKAVCFMSNL